MSHAATPTSSYSLTMSWQAALRSALRWFLIAAGGQLVALAAFHERGVFSLGAEDWELIANVGIIAALGWLVDFLNPKPPTAYGITKNEPPPAITPPEDGTP